MVVDLVDRTDIRVVEAGDRLRLPLEASRRFRLPASSSDRNFRATGRDTKVFAFVDDPHPAGSQLTRYSVVGNRAPDHGGRGYQSRQPAVRFGSGQRYYRYDADLSRHDPAGPDTPASEDTYTDALLSDETTMEMVVRAREGDRMANKMNGNQQHA